MLISTFDELASFCDRIGDASIIYLDTEFVREDSYVPRLEIIQILANEEIGLIDYPAIRNPEPLWKILHDPAIEKVFHAAAQDLSLFFQESRSPVVNVFDTQIAAAFIGMGEQISYGQLVQNICGVALSKSQSYTPWGTRPLTRAQMEYAQDDVRYLPAITEHLKLKLDELGRTDWAHEEFRMLEASVTAETVPVDELFWRVRGVDSLHPKELAVLRAVTEWRELEAQNRNRPPGRILRDEAMVNVARQKPASVDVLRNMRGFPAVVADRHGSDIVRVVSQAVNLPKDQWPRRRQGRQTDSSIQTIVTLLQTFVRIRAFEKQTAWGLITNAKELEDLAEKYPDIKEGDLPVLSGWRFEMAGRDILRLLRGEIALGIDSGSGKPAIVRSEGV